MALAGARTDTAAQMRAALHVAAGAEGQEAETTALLARLRGPGGRSGLALANALWTQGGRPLLEPVREVVEREFQAAVRQADFGAPPSPLARTSTRGWRSRRERGCATSCRAGA